MAPEQMDEAAWRKHVVEQFASVNMQLRAGQTCFRKIQHTLSKIDHSTQLARDVQDVSEAAGLLYRTSCRTLAILGKMIMWGGISIVVIYMLSHNGEIPSWGKPWLLFLKEVK